MILLISGFIGITLAYTGGIVLAGNLLNKRYASRLSEEVESYRYGKDAEYYLVVEDLHQRVKSGELSKDEFSKFDFARYLETSDL